MVGDPTGYAGPHPDLRQLACDSINGMRNMMREHGRDPEPGPAVTVDTIVVRCQCTWHGVVEGDDGERNGNYSVAIMETETGGLLSNAMIEAVQLADGDDWKRYAMPGGIGRRDSGDERESGMLFLGALMSVGGSARSDRSATFRVEYAGGSTFESSFVDNYAIVLTPTISPAYPTELATFSWVDLNGEVLDSAQIGAASR